MKLLRIAEVKSRLGFRSDASVFQQMADGVLPPSISIGGRAKAWLDTEIDAIIVARVLGKDDDALREIVKSIVEKRAALVA